MSDKDRDLDSMQYATLENVNKCIDNANRLYDDALKTSPPTQAALIELSIEELAKALLVLYKTRDFENSLVNVKFVDATKIVNNLNETDFIKILDAFKISDFTTRAHDKKLKFIQFLAERAKQFFGIYGPLMVPSINAFGSNFSKYLSKSVMDPLKITGEELSKLVDADIGNLDDYKNEGFYVDFKDGKVIEPKNVSFPFETLFRVYIFIHIQLQIAINLPEGINPQDYSLKMKELANKLANKPPFNPSKDAADNKIIICSVCKYENPKPAKFCMECGAKLE